MATVLIPTALQQYAGGEDELAAAGNTVQEVLDNLTETYAAQSVAPTADGAAKFPV